jgi:hypothetical protein
MFVADRNLASLLQARDFGGVRIFFCLPWLFAVPKARYVGLLINEEPKVGRR